MIPLLPAGRSGRIAEEIALLAAGIAGRRIVPAFAKAKQLRYKGKRDIVTDTDIAAEKAIVELIRQEFPDHGFLAEESGTAGEAAEYQWIIDPLDGTLNFSQTIPIFCTSIALSHQGQVILGVIVDPLRKETFVAAKGKGSRLNGKPIQVTTKTDLTSAVVGFDLGYNEEGRKRAMEQAHALLPTARTLRLIGSAALALAYTAAGRFDAFFHHWLYPWDLAAGTLLVSEAGGEVTDWDGNPFALETRGIVAANSALRNELLKRLI